MGIEHDPGKSGPSGEGEAVLILIFISYLLSISMFYFNRRKKQIELPSQTEEIYLENMELEMNHDSSVEDKKQLEYWQTSDEYLPSVVFKQKFIRTISLGTIQSGDYENIENNSLSFKLCHCLACINWIKVGLFFSIWICLWLFLICLGLMSTGFKLLGGKDAAKMFDVVDNPISGLMIGILSTVFVQSSSTTTSIIVGLVGSDEMSVKTGIPMIMGANIGTSVTNTLVSLSHFGDKDELRRGFAAATVHDCFNLLSVLILLPIQWATNLFYHLTYNIAKNIDACNDDVNECDKHEFLQPYLKPYYNDVAEYDKKVAKYVSQDYCDGLCKDKSSIELRTLLTTILCDDDKCNSIKGFKDSWLTNNVLKAERVPKFIQHTNNLTEYLLNCPTTYNCSDTLYFWNYTNNTVNNTVATILNSTNNEFVNTIITVCNNMNYNLCDARLLKGGIFYRDWHLSDNSAGALCVVLSLSGICTILYLIVQTLNILIKGKFAKLLKITVSYNGYLSMLIGMFLTIMVQSSSITTSVLTPLVAIGLIPLTDMYPLTLGANLGTTVTGILAASVVTSNPLAAWQIALSHFFFNLFGIILWYPLTITRNIPIKMATYLGKQTVQYKSFPFVYTGTVFFAIPGIVYGLSSINY